MPATPSPRRFAPALLALLILLILPIQSTQPALAEEFVDPHRLGEAVVPTQQTIELRLDARESDYTGSVSIALTVNEAASSFHLHAQDLVFDRVELVSDGTKQELQHEAGEADLVTLSAATPIAPGDYRLEIDFHNAFDTRAHSLYRLDYEGEAYTYTQFEAVDARGAFPCFDEPAFKIPWQMTLTVPSVHQALSNTPIAKQSEENDWVRYEFEATPPMPSYLLAIATGPFDAVDVPGMRIPTRVVCPKGKAHLAGEAVRVTPAILGALEGYFDREYPYRKLDLIAVPEFWPGAMENPGAITYRESLLLLDPEALTVSQKRRLASVHAHELAHQWFGNLVTMEWWDDLWLNESFATWLGNKITDQVYPEYGLAVTSVEANEGAMFLDAKSTTEAIRAPILAEDNMENMQAGITYSKGAAVLGMFESFIGEDLFRDGVRNYIRGNEWGNAVGDDLFDAISATAGVDVSAAMSTFLDQPGVPNLRVDVLGDGKVEFTQSRFSNYGAQLEPERDWQIPVVFRWSDGKQERTQRVLLTQPSQIVELPGGARPEWIHPNSGEMGYYRWELPPDRLLDLVARARESLQPRERVALVGVLSAQLDAGRLGGGDYLRATNLLSTDPEPRVLDAALSSLMKVRMAFVTAEDKDAFAAYVRATVRPALDRFGLKAQPGESEAVAELRPTLLNWLGASGEDPEVLAYAREVADAYLADRGSVDPSIAGVCLRLAAADGGWKLYNAYKKNFEEAEVPAERGRFLAAMGGFEDKTMQRTALNYAIDGPTRPQELFTIPMGVAQYAIDDPDFMWNWFVDRYADIVDKIPEMFTAYLPYFASGCDEERLVAAREFFARPDVRKPGQDVQLDRVAETVVDCARLREREGQSVRDFLAEYTKAN